jgi:hypothetical protein
VIADLGLEGVLQRFARDCNGNCVSGWSNSSQGIDQVGPESIAEEQHQLEPPSQRDLLRDARHSA